MASLPSPDILEPAIRRIGQELAARSAGHTPTLFNPKWWSNALLTLCMKDEAFKVQLFRFIDVLPSLHTDEQVARILEEYFGKELPLAAPLQWGMKALSATSFGAKLGAKSIRQQTLQMAKTFLTGASVTDALPTLADLWKSHRGYSVDLLGEATVSEHEADQYRDRCCDALHQLRAATSAWPSIGILEKDHLGQVPRVQLSIKLSALYSQMDPIDPEGSYRGVASRLRPILDLAMSLPAAVTFDMEQAELKDLTLMIFQRVLFEDGFRYYPYAGIAIQAYLKATQNDLTGLAQWVRKRGVPITVRLVKGAYWDADTIRFQQRGWPVPVWEYKWQTDANYEAMTRLLIEQAAVMRPAFGTHNLRSLAHAQAAAEAARLPVEACEFQMIYGMAEPLQSAVAAGGRRVRIYAPAGDLLPGMAYLVRRLLENTSNESFLRKQYAEAESIDHLLAPPSEPRGSVASRPSATVAPVTPMPDASFTNEPLTDFSQAAPRATMEDALGRVRGRLGKTFPVGGPASPAPTGPDLLSRDPSRPLVTVGRLMSYDPASVPDAAAAASEASHRWAVTPAQDRAAVMTKAAALMRERRFELAAWEIFECGKSWREADGDLAEGIDFLEFYARDMVRLSKPQRLGDEPGELNQLAWAPRGLVAVISPWNFPLAIPTGMVGAALVTGNGVLFKPSERSPIMGYWLAAILRDAGLPDGVLQFLPGGPSLGRAVVGHPDVQVIAFTGSRAVGLKIVEEASRTGAAARHVKRVIAEMGGKNAIIVDDSADLDEAVTGVVSSFTGFQGQKCSACSRVIVLESAYDTFLQRLTDTVLSLRIAPADDPGCQIGPMIDERARATVLDYIEIGRREGRLVVQREVPAEGYFAGPAVFADIEPSHRLAQEEIFGPVLAVMRARSFEEALAVANSTPYALTGGLYSRSPKNIQLARERFDVGNLYVNRPITGALVGRQPFGGHRLSGVGAKAGGEGYLLQFMTARVVSENTLRRGFAPLL